MRIINIKNNTNYQSSFAALENSDKAEKRNNYRKKFLQKQYERKI